MSIDHEALRVLMDKDGQTAVTFAARLGISVQYLCDILAGRRTLKRSPELLSRMARELNVPRSMLEHRAPGEDVA